MIGFMSKCSDLPIASNGQRRAPDPAPRVLRLRDAPRYLGMNRNLFNSEVRPCVREERWDWEFEISELETSVFVVPRELVKNKEDRLIVLNKVARSVIDGARRKHAQRVFTYRGRPVQRIGNSAWQRARKRAAERYAPELGSACPDGFRRCRVHDLRHYSEFRIIPTKFHQTGIVLLLSLTCMPLAA
jgi:hypothetical protein